MTFAADAGSFRKERDSQGDQQQSPDSHDPPAKRITNNIYCGRSILHDIPPFLEIPLMRSFLEPQSFEA
jgi:hypothetical protein